MRSKLACKMFFGNVMFTTNALKTKKKKHTWICSTMPHTLAAYTTEYNICSMQIIQYKINLIYSK